MAVGRGMLDHWARELVRQMFEESTLATFPGHLVIGHTAYSTAAARGGFEPCGRGP
jgi:glutamine phosphoribosylpyrophosphate amidotransferase